MIPWFSKTEGNTYATLLHHPLLFGEIQRSAQEVAVPRYPNRRARIKPQAEQASQAVDDDQMIVYAS